MYINITKYKKESYNHIVIAVVASPSRLVCRNNNSLISTILLHV